MTTIEFYEKLDYDFSIHEGEEELKGLTIGGFQGTAPLHVKDFNQLELKTARDMIVCKLKPIKAINQRSSSYGLKHLIEHALRIETNGQINYVSNGTLIFVMYDAGYNIKRDGSSPNCYFNVSKKSINDLAKYINKR
ncbi:hypothetical protein PO073_24595 [Bacteroides thetaiotaomicron]|jgi:hypothetical protein|uniref:hypothetical protein n=1 Tax=Bacteroides thetaiotaomicron TaxID=818 RepID=UPI00189E6968|nr:hypothetical protein [Bacteroides thetaiotaomicron]MDC2175199.1 hypothetical protein [Bacteroides thetaiotaomicron]MDC2190805.1 hypothetical protein [Bacteroides thetaiotaomicron]